jgi:hypothetical protein
MKRQTIITSAMSFLLVCTSTRAIATTPHEEAVNHEARYSGILDSMKQEDNRQRTAMQHISADQQKANQNAALHHEALAHEARYSGIVNSMKQEDNRQRTQSQQVSTDQQKANQNAALHNEAVAHQARFSGITQSMAQAKEMEAHAARYSAANINANTNSTINQSAGSLNPHTQVTATINGKTVHTTAGQIAKTNPNTQISMGFNSTFTGKNSSSHSDHADGTCSSEHGTGNGGNNAANSASAHGLGGGDHIGGGRSGGGFHY